MGEWEGREGSREGVRGTTGGDGGKENDASDAVGGKLVFLRLRTGADLAGATGALSWPLLAAVKYDKYCALVMMEGGKGGSRVLEERRNGEYVAFKKIGTSKIGTVNWDWAKVIWD